MPSDRPEEPTPEDRMVKWFAWEHLQNEALREVSSHFKELALTICSLVESGPERTVALRKLLESLDCAIRAISHPGG